jgi:hypothetical protein
LERGTLAESVRGWHYRAGWFLLDDDAVELDDPMGWERLRSSDIALGLTLMFSRSTPDISWRASNKFLFIKLQGCATVVAEPLPCGLASANILTQR